MASLRSAAGPSVAEKFVGGLQWAITGSYVFLLGLVVAAWYLRLTRTVASLELSRQFVGFVVAAFVAGYLWVGWVESRSSDADGRSDAHARRIEVVVTLLVLGFLFPFGVPRLFDQLGVGPREFPLFGFGVAYALALAVSYGLVYGLGTRFFLGPDPEGLRE